MSMGFKGWLGKVDIWAARILVILFTMLAASQILLLNHTLKSFISRIDKLEGKSISDSQLFIQKGEIEVSIENNTTLRPLIFYVNGEDTAVFSGKSIRIQVKNGDVIEVGGSEMSDTAILKVFSVSDNIIVPELGKLIYVNNNLVLIDRIKIK